MIRRWLSFLQLIARPGFDDARLNRLAHKSGRRVIFQLQDAGKGRLIAHKLGFERSSYYDRSTRDNADMG